MILTMKVSTKRSLRVGDTNTDILGPGPHRAKRQRRTSTVEGDDGKKKYEKRPGLARWEVATNNLQVRDPATGQWREYLFPECPESC